MHFDFHANKNNHDVGAASDPVALEKMLREADPDFVQVDTKGHPGLSSYPTNAGTRADLAEGIDRLKIWREVTEKLGIGLYAHHSGLYDAAAVEEHPDWAVINEDGTRSERLASVFSPFAKERLIPQLKELAVDYRLDGVWMDGDCWGGALDYGPAAEKAYFEATGKPLPKKGDPDYENYLKFSEDAFDAYMREYCDEVHAVAPGFQICGNWIYGHHHPQRMDLPLDFVSGDVSKYDDIRLIVRMFQKSGKPWDNMSWPAFCDGVFNVFDVEGCAWIHKSIPQLEQEAALSVSLGGGFEYCDPIMDKMTSPYIPIYVALSRFCKARKPYCFNAEPVHQAAVYHPEERPLAFSSFGWPDRHGTNYYTVNWDYAVTGAIGSLVDLLLDAGISTEVAFNNEDLSPYGIVAVPNYPLSDPADKAKLLSYAENGGKLVLFGPDTLGVFADDLGITVNPIEKKCGYIEGEELPVAVPGSFCEVKGDFEVKATMKKDWLLCREPMPAVFTVKYGKGEIWGVAAAFSDYGRLPVVSNVNFIRKLVDEIWPRRAVKVSGSSHVNVALMRKDGVLSVNLINTAETLNGKIGWNSTVEEIPPLYNIEVEVAVDEAPAAVTSEPDHTPLDFTYSDGKVRFTLPRLDIHTVVTVK